MKRIVLVAMLATSACGNSAQQIAAYCTNLGAGPGSPDYLQCAQTEQAIRTQAWLGIASVGLGYAAASARPSRSVTCHSSYGFTTCNGW